MDTNGPPRLFIHSYIAGENSNPGMLVSSHGTFEGNRCELRIFI